MAAGMSGTPTAPEWPDPRKRRRRLLSAFRQSLDPRLRGMKGEVDRIETMLNEVSESAGTEGEALVQRFDALKAESSRRPRRSAGKSSHNLSRMPKRNSPVSVRS